MDFANFDYSILFRLVAAVILSGLVGLERGGSNHEAGLRTHIVLCLGAALVMIVSECLVKKYGSGDIMRMGAQVISGVGFLGIGSIIVDGNKVKGITTAAGLWTTACIGIAVGCGFYIIAVTVAALMLFAMMGLRSFKHKVYPKSLKYNVKIDMDDRHSIKKVLKTLIAEHVEVHSVKVEEEGSGIYAILGVKLQKNSNFNKIASEILACDGVKEFVVVSY